MKPKRSIMVFLMFVLLVSSCPGLFMTGGVVYAADDFAGGDGTPGNPFQIASSDQLNKIRNYLDSHFILTNDIDMSSFDTDNPWGPIGDEAAPFTGGLDGGNFKITNLFIDLPSSSQPVGLFGVVSGTTSYIENLIVEAVEVRGRDHVGILAGRNSTTIRSVGVTGSVYGQNFVGGMTGSHRDSIISNSYATGPVKGVSDVGGLIGLMDNGNVSYSYASGDVTGSVDVGGFIGQQENSQTSYSYATGRVAGCVDTGGFVGDNGDSLILNSFATGSVTGLCEAGGDHSDSVGGLVGDNSDGTIENSYATGQVTGGSPIGGLAGVGGSINSYYDKDTTGQSDASGQGLTSDEMKDRNNYTGWDFDTTWDIQAPHHNGYPYVKAIQSFVTYAGNGTDHSSEPYSSQSYLPGSTVEILEKRNDWMKTGFRFKGWNTAADGSGDTYRAQDTIVLNGNVLLFADWQPLAAPTLLAPTDGQYLNSRLPTISGSADAGASVVLILDEIAAATVTAASDGSWSWTPAAELAEGLHKIRAGIADSTGNPIRSSAEHTFTVDTVSPVITLIGAASIALTAGTSFVDPGATVTDAEENIPVTITGSVDHNVPGTYTLHYDATDRAGNAAASVTRTVRVVERSSGGGGGGIRQPSDNANLSLLTVTADGNKLALTPEFTAGTTRYQVETTADKVAIEAIPSDSNAKITLDNTSFAGRRTVPLTAGKHEFEIAVKAESGLLKTYKLTIQRVTQPVEPQPETNGCAFRDIKGHWAEPLICEALGVGIVEGYSQTSFQPQAYITRAEFAAMLLRTLGIRSGSAGGELIFTDQDQIPGWATDVVSAAVEYGILQGYPDHSLQPMKRVNRSEMVAMMAKAMKWEMEQGDTAFADDSKIPAWVKGYINGAVQRNVVNGREGNRFSPAELATRAEATALLLRLWHIHNGRNSESGE